jgi:dienelactone hydrolase
MKNISQKDILCLRQQTVLLCLGALSLMLCVRTAPAQQPERFVYTLPAVSRVAVQKNIEYRKIGDRALKFDLYRLSLAEKPASVPVVMLVNSGFGRPDFKDSFHLREWAKLCAASGLAAISYDAHKEGWVEDFDALMAYLRQQKTALGVDPETIIIQAGSGLVTHGLPLAMDTNRPYIKAAVIYYGIAEVKELRTDLPLLIVRAGLDVPALNRRIDQFVANALAVNAPLEVLNYPGGHHPFEDTDDNEFSRQVMARALEFMQRAVSPAMQQAIRASHAEAQAAGALLAENWTAAVNGYEALVNKDAQNAELNRRHGDALYGAKAYAKAVQAYERAFSLGSWRKRDISYPAAVAAVRTNDLDGALKWIERLINTPFNAQSLRTDPNFEPVRNHQRFNALIESKKQ